MPRCTRSPARIPTVAAIEGNGRQYCPAGNRGWDQRYPGMFEIMAKYNVLGVEMEAAGMFPIAAEHGVEALAICTVSDDIRTGDALSTDERQNTFDEMILVALETVRISEQEQ